MSLVSLDRSQFLPLGLHADQRILFLGDFWPLHRLSFVVVAVEHLEISLRGHFLFSVGLDEVRFSLL